MKTIFPHSIKITKDSGGEFITCRFGNSLNCHYKMRVLVRRADGNLLVEHATPGYKRDYAILIKMSSVSGNNWHSYEVVDQSKRQVIDF